MADLSFAIADLYADDNVAADGWYTPPGGGTAVPIRVRFAERPRGARLDQLRTPHLGPIARLMRRDTLVPAEDGILAVGSRLFSIRRLDLSRDGVEWLLELAEQA